MRSQTREKRLETGVADRIDSEADTFMGGVARDVARSNRQVDGGGMMRR